MMTIEEKRKRLSEYCDSRSQCGDCPLKDWSTSDCYFDEWSDMQVTIIYDGIFNRPITGEAVEHPGHYNREGAMECIREMVLIFGVEETMIFCKLNAWKYRYRAADKGGLEDLKKSDWYIHMYEKLKDGECL